jgi:hypothetical protein
MSSSPLFAPASASKTTSGGREPSPVSDEDGGNGDDRKLPAWPQPQQPKEKSNFQRLVELLQDPEPSWPRIRDRISLLDLTSLNTRTRRSARTLLDFCRPPAFYTTDVAAVSHPLEKAFVTIYTHPSFRPLSHFRRNHYYFEQRNVRRVAWLICLAHDKKRRMRVFSHHIARLHGALEEEAKGAAPSDPLVLLLGITRFFAESRPRKPGHWRDPQTVKEPDWDELHQYALSVLNLGAPSHIPESDLLLVQRSNQLCTEYRLMVESNKREGGGAHRMRKIERDHFRPAYRAFKRAFDAGEAFPGLRERLTSPPEEAR